MKPGGKQKKQIRNLAKKLLSVGNDAGKNSVQEKTQSVECDFQRVDSEVKGDIETTGQTVLMWQKYEDALVKAEEDLVKLEETLPSAVNISLPKDELKDSLKYLQVC